ncbi:hypothetical protein E2F46_14910 [Luteimonas aestuarii]|uniref:Uncharacterized protein n=1 Tax=Luteimonas aestuarii TaxID=453837 RepID=A0A4V3ALD1_9GAMM|nr:hypothetical protein [Luteimonas aestuarii]TDK21521.1 hypothetical protein E2F46_14910 [Luteimonas aestuarii]
MRAAERIDDRLQRCLAYPDLPGNRWPAGHVEANCRYRVTEVVTLAEIDGYLQRGEVAVLEQVMSGYLARHFSAAGHGDEIHLAIARFSDVDDDADRISTRWLELAPRSAFAHMARAAHIHRLARAARGGAYVRDTPRENMRRMSELAAEAIPLYQQAIAIEPRAMPAYAGLIGIARIDSRHELLQQAVASASRQDPACWHVADQRMMSATPRWGGSYEEMLAIAAELSRHLDRRPLLALTIAEPYADRGERLLAAKQYTREAMQLLDIAIRTAPSQAALVNAGEMAQKLPPEQGGADHWKSMSLLLQRARFTAVDAWTARELAWFLLGADPSWSLRYATRAVELDPGNRWAHFLLASAYKATGQVDAAEKHYLVAIEDEARHRESLGELAHMMLYPAPEAAPLLERARPYIERFVAAYPDDSLAWLIQIEAELLENGDKVDGNLIRGFLARANLEDPRQAEWARLLQASLNDHAPSSKAAAP